MTEEAKATVAQKKSKLNIPMTAACILLCLTLFSFHFTGGLYARYITTASGDDSARVIKFGELTLTETGDFYQENKLMITPGVDLNKKATVSFTGSESATYVFLSVIPTKWHVSGDNKMFSVTVGSKTVMNWSLADGWVFLKTDNGAYVYYRVLAPNTALVSADIIAGGKITVSNQITRSEIGSDAMQGISISFRAAAVQIGGFADAGAAWSSIAAKGG